MKKKNESINVKIGTLTEQEAALMAQIPQVIELVDVGNGFAKIKYHDTISYLCIGDKLTFTIPYVAKVSNHEHIKGELNIKYEFCPTCGEKNG